MRKFSEFKLFSKELKRTVDISVSLPTEYHQSKRNYPVLYMTDGQNLFDDNLATYGKSWGILESYEKNQDLPQLIVVGISSNEERSNELIPYPFSFFGEKKVWGGKADLFIEFIIKSLMPAINNQYRTLKNPENTGMIGSSFGGVFATYVALKYNTYFTKFGCLSNAYFPVLDKLLELAKESDLKKVDKFYMDVGTKESKDVIENNNYIEDNQQMYQVLSEKIASENLQFVIIKDGIHHESAWELRFPKIIKYLFEQ